MPGVYIRQEDGYGLRPNIGMRGSSSERSAKIALMEDGILIAPAPYSAPAAYYFPMMTRITRVEVSKGPSAIRYGPNTVGGAVNLISKPIPRDRELTLDVAGGQYRFGKLHATVAEAREHVAVMVEALKLRTDGFKELDNGASTGFDKNDFQVKMRLSSSSDAEIYHRLDLKVGYSDELSNETYTGLTDDDFAMNPYHRYAGTQLDNMDWRHLRFQLGHHIDMSGKLQVDTTIYRNDFTRDWAKLKRIFRPIAPWLKYWPTPTQATTRCSTRCSPERQTRRATPRCCFSAPIRGPSYPRAFRSPGGADFRPAPPITS